MGDIPLVNPSTCHDTSLACSSSSNFLARLQKGHALKRASHLAGKARNEQPAIVVLI